MAKAVLTSGLVGCLIFFPATVRADAEDALKDAAVHIWRDQKRMATSPLRVDKIDLLIWGTAAGSLLYLAPRWGQSRSADERLEQGINRKNVPLDDFLHGFTHVGDAPVLFGASLTGYGLGRWQNWPTVRRTSLHVFEGLMDVGIATELIKILAGRRRPVDDPTRGPFLGPKGYFRDRSDNSSFLSGHAAMSFVTATIITNESRSYWVGVPAYLVASGIAYSRIYVARHWLSDVLGGAALGYSVGFLVENQRHAKATQAGRIRPFVEEDTAGLVWSRPF